MPVTRRDAEDVVVCTWPDGRVMRRVRLSGDGWVAFNSAPQVDQPHDFELQFELMDGRPFVETLPAFIRILGDGGAAWPKQADLLRYSAGSPEPKLLWFAQEVGLSGTPDRRFPIELYHSSSPPAPVVPVFIPEESFRVRNVHGGASTREEAAETVKNTLVGELVTGTSAGITGFEVRPAREVFEIRTPALSRRYGLRGKIDVERLSENQSASGRWRVQIGNESERGDSLGAALGKLLRRRGFLGTLDLSHWLAALDRGELLGGADLDTFRLLDEPVPLLWPWELFLEWARSLDGADSKPAAVT